MNSWATRIASALFIVAVSGVYSLWLKPVFGFPERYFLFAALDLFMILGYRELGNNSISRDLQRINMISIANHAFGFVIYMLYFPPHWYNVSLFILKAIEWLRLLMVLHDDNLPGNNFRIDLLLKSFVSRTNRPTKAEAK